MLKVIRTPLVVKTAVISTLTVIKLTMRRQMNKVSLYSLLYVLLFPLMLIQDIKLMFFLIQIKSKLVARCHQVTPTPTPPMKTLRAATQVNHLEKTAIKALQRKNRVSSRLHLHPKRHVIHHQRMVIGVISRRQTAGLCHLFPL